LNPEFSSVVENGGDCTRVSAPCDTLEAGTIFIWNAPEGAAASLRAAEEAIRQGYAALPAKAASPQG